MVIEVPEMMEIPERMKHLISGLPRLPRAVVRPVDGARVRPTDAIWRKLGGRTYEPRRRDFRRLDRGLAFPVEYAALQPKRPFTA